MTGEPVYIELGVQDADAAREFYGPLLGWNVSGKAGPGEANTAGLNVGIHNGDDSSLFEVFFAVDDLDASIAKVAELGGRSVGKVNDSPGLGRWIECADNQNVRFGLLEKSNA